MSQVYSLVSDRTAVDKDVAALCSSGLVRRLRLGSSSRHALIFAQDYLAMVERAAATAAATDEALRSALAAFAARALPATRGPDVSSERLRSRLDREGECDGEAAVAALMHAGLIARDPSHSEVLLFCCPGLGALQRALEEGRRGVAATLRRRAQRQAFRDDLERIKMRGCCLPTRYLIRDMLGGDALHILKVPKGEVLRLKTNG